MPALVRSRWLALAGLLLLVPLALGLLRGTLSLETAALRGGVLLLALAVVERVVLPILGTLVGPPSR